MKHGKGRLTPIQRKRFVFWRARGLSLRSAREFSEFPLGRPYVQRFYKALQSTPSFRSLSLADLWALFRREYNYSIGLGEYEPPPEKHYSSKGPHRRLLPDGTVDRSHARNYEKARRSTSKPSKGQAARDKEWISQLEKAIENTQDPVRKAQYQSQIENIRRRLERNG